MLRTYFIFGWVVLSAMASPTNASAPPHCAGAAQIRALVEPALEKAGFAGARFPASSDITCPGVLDGTETMEVASVRWDALIHSIEVRMRCQRNACLPFVLQVQPGAGETIPPAKNSIHSLAGTGQSLPVLERRGRSLVRAGEIVTVVWEQDGVRVTRPVVCLDRGDAGQLVRTRNQQGGRIVRARVLGTGLVKVE